VGIGQGLLAFSRLSCDRLSPFALNMQTLLRLRNSASSRGESPALWPYLRRVG
jgi:hypothetical protein